MATENIVLVTLKNSSWIILPLNKLTVLISISFLGNRLRLLFFREFCGEGLIHKFLFVFCFYFALYCLIKAIFRNLFEDLF